MQILNLLFDLPSNSKNLFESFVFYSHLKVEKKHGSKSCKIARAPCGLQRAGDEPNCGFGNIGYFVYAMMAFVYNLENQSSG